MGLLSHLVELRDRLLRMLLAVGIFFLCLFPFSKTIWTYLSEPLTRHAGTMQAIDIASPFLIPFKVCLLLSIVLAAPVLLYQIWAFVAPGLYKHEKRLITPLLLSSTVLFSGHRSLSGFYHHYIYSLRSCIRSACRNCSSGRCWRYYS